MGKKDRYNKSYRPIEWHPLGDYGKMPPQAVDIEEAVLGALINDGDSFDKVSGLLKPEVFYKDSHQKIFHACFDLYEKKKIIDLFTVTEELRSNGGLEEVGGVVYLTGLTSKVVVASNIKYHSQILSEKFLRRELIRISAEMKEKAFDEGADLSDIYDSYEKEYSTLFDDNIKDKASFSQIKNNSKLLYGNEYEKPPYCFYINGKGIFTHSNFSVIKGKAKSRKSTFLSLVLSSFLTHEDVLRVFSSRLQGKLLVFDTEQSKFFVNRIIDMACRLADVTEHPPALEVYCLRPYSPKERVKFIEDTMYGADEINFVIIDGIRDLITDINSAEQATEISTKLMKWTEEKDCHITTVLHANKGDGNARGHIGTELQNKAEAVINIEKKDKMSIVEPEYMRGGGFESFSFGLDRNYLPYIGSSIDENSTGEFF